MPYRIDFLEDAAADWARLDPSIRKKLAKAVNRLKSNPSSYGKALGAELHGLRRLRAGDFRIVYRILETLKRRLI